MRHAHHAPLTLAVFAGLLFIACPIQAQAPNSLGFQGYLTDSGGKPLDSTGVSITFKLYKDGTAIWGETQLVNASDGVFNVLLGKSTPMDTVAFNKPIDLGVKLDGEPAEMSPRTPLTSVAYARALPGLYTYYREDADQKSYNVVGGAGNNFVGSGAVGATIGGGGGFYTSTPVPNRVLSDFATVGGGYDNTASGFNATVSGGYNNAASGTRATVSGGELNVAGQVFATVGGGYRNTASGTRTTVGGGFHNTASDYGATVGGGYDNTASGSRSTVGGGDENAASGSYATVGGGYRNTASGIRATVPGGWDNSAAGDYTFAAGYKAKANHEGTFVWNDRSVVGSLNDELVSTGNNQFLIRAVGGVGIGTNSPAGNLHITSDSGPIPHLMLQETESGDYARLRLKNDDNSEYWRIEAGGTDNEVLNIYTSQGGRGAIMSFRAAGDPLVMYNTARLTHSGIWKNASSSALKTDYKEIDPYEILQKLSALPLTQWRYKVEPETVRHLGPVAEDFSAAFGLGQDDATIGTVDADGVALAAIQGLYELVKEQQAEIERMREVMQRAGLE